MKIKKITIENFRSIKYIEVFPSSLYWIVGPNSAGKSNILRAIDLVLWDGWLTKNKVEKELFNDPKFPIRIQIDFEEPITWKYFNNSCSIRHATAELSICGGFEAKARLWTNADKTDKNWDWFWMNDDFKHLCNFVYIPSDRQFDKQFNASWWTMLGKIMKEIHYAYIEKHGSEEALKKAFEEKMQGAKDFLQENFSEESITYSRFLDEFQKNCSNNSSWSAQVFEPRLEIYDPNMFYRTLQIFLNEESAERSFHISEVWSGMQNMVLIAIFQTYAKLMKNSVIFWIEEPELFLYPHAQRSLYRTFRAIAEEGTQILYTTHNPNFLDCARPDQLVLVQKSVWEWTISRERKRFASRPLIDESLRKSLAHFSNERAELFFAKKVILVEGVSDKIFFTRYIEEIYDFDINWEGISIIECSGKMGVLYFIWVCRGLWIDYFAVWDKDNENSIEDNHWLFSATITELLWMELDKNLEDFLEREGYNLPFGKKEKIKNALEINISSIWAFDMLKRFLGITSSVVSPRVDMNSDISENPF
jgi:putative ATP-dependent endonuclease of the OLD family